MGTVLPFAPTIAFVVEFFIERKKQWRIQAEAGEVRAIPQKKKKRRRSSARRAEKRSCEDRRTLSRELTENQNVKKPIGADESVDSEAGYVSSSEIEHDQLPRAQRVDFGPEQKWAFGIRGHEVGADLWQLYPVLLLVHSLG